MKIFRTPNSTQWPKTASQLTVQNLKPGWVYAMKFQIFWKICFPKPVNKRCSMLYYFGVIIGRALEGHAAEGQDALSSALLRNLPPLSNHSSMHSRTAGQRRRSGPGSRAVLWASSSFSVAWNTGNLKNFLEKRGEKQMRPNLKRNKIPIVLSCIYFHWKISLFLHNPFTFWNLHFRSDTLSSDPWNTWWWMTMKICSARHNSFPE